MTQRQDVDIVTATLAKLRGSFLCGGCLGLAAGLSLQAARATMETLRDDARAAFRHGPCSVCARALDLIGAGTALPRAVGADIVVVAPAGGRAGPAR